MLKPRRPGFRLTTRMLKPISIMLSQQMMSRKTNDVVKISRGEMNNIKASNRGQFNLNVTIFFSSY